MTISPPIAPIFVTHLECSLTGERYEADEIHNLSRAGRPLLVRYDLAAARAALSRDTLEARPTDLWRWRELLPVRHTASIVSLGEIETPLIPIPRSGGRNVLVKDEGRLPTGSFKARGLVMAVAMARELGVTRIAMPTNGNAGAALAAYAARCGIETVIFAPEETPEVNIREIAAQGARVYRVNGQIDECGALVGRGAAEGRGSISRRSRSRIGSRARRRWGSSWPRSSAGNCPTRSSIRPAAGPG